MHTHSVLSPAPLYLLLPPTAACGDSRMVWNCTILLSVVTTTCPYPTMKPVVRIPAEDAIFDDPGRFPLDCFAVSLGVPCEEAFLRRR